MVGALISIWSVVGGSWSVVCGFVLRLSLFTNRSLWHPLVHTLLIDNNFLMDKVYSHYIYLPAYLKLMNIDTTRIPNVRDNNFICV